MARTVRASRERRATASVELAAVLPLILLLLFGVWEVGRLVEVQQIMTNAAREGGRQASTGRKTTAEVQQAVLDYLTRAGVPTTNAVVTIENLTDSSRSDPTQANQLDRFRVTVTLPFDDVKWIMLNQITSGSSITGVADWFSMRNVPLEVDPTVPVAN